MPVAERRKVLSEDNDFGAVRQASGFGEMITRHIPGEPDLMIGMQRLLA